VTLDSYTLLPIDDSLAGDNPTQTRIAEYIGHIDALVTPLAYNAPIAQTAFDVPQGPGETALGDLVTDAYRNVVAGIYPDDPPVVGIDAAGAIRSRIARGKTGVISFADAFAVVPLGIGPDTHPGYPLVTFYLAGSDLRAGLELAAAGEVVGGDFVIQTSGLEAHYDASKPAFQRITSLKVGNTTVGLTDTTPCFRITTTLYVAGLLGVVSSVTSGHLSVVPKQKDCTTVITNMQGQIVFTGAGSAAAELKAWQALLRYLSSLPANPTDGGVPLPELPAIFMQPQGRVVTP
jgi:hypothetical protein